MSGDTPDIVLNEFGDLSRKARRELEARGIDPTTAVVEYIAATGQIPIITPEAAAAAKAEAQAEAAVARDHDIFSGVGPASVIVPVEEPPREPANTSQNIILPQSSVLPVSVPVTAAETGPIEPLTVAPALDSGSLSAIEETLAAVSDQTVEVLTTGFDALVSAESEELPKSPSKRVARRLAQKEKKERALAQKAEKKTAAAEAKLEAVREKTAQELREREETQLAAEQAEELRINAEEELLSREAEVSAAEEARIFAQAEEDAQASAVEGVITEEVLEESGLSKSGNSDDDELDDEEFEPQTISEATAAIAIAEAVAAAEAVVEAGEVNIEYGNLANSVPATTGSISVISNALILSTLPETTGSIAPINPTGEIVITGSILIPSSVSQLGVNLEKLDTSEIDVIRDDEEVAPTQGMAPVSAATAVSAYNISTSVVTTPRGRNERLPFILSITAAGLAVGVVALFVAGYFLGLF